MEQVAVTDPRPIDTVTLEQEVARQSAQWGCRAAFNYDELRRLTERKLRLLRIRQEMIASAIKPVAEEIDAF